MGQTHSTSRSSRGPLVSKGEEDAALDSGSDVPTLQLPPPAPSDKLALLKNAKGHYWYPQKGHRILDACGGAGVASIGHGNKEVIRAVNKQMKQYTYASYAHFNTKPVQDLSDWLIKSTNNKMQKVYLMSSGSEAIEASLKLAIEYHIWNRQPTRIHFIAREQSYHGTTLGSLSCSGHTTRRAPLSPTSSSPTASTASLRATPTAGAHPAETDAEFVERKVDELVKVIEKLGPETVAGVVLEPVVGAAMGCAPAVSGYLAG
ncbi:hypothetical protein N0V88_001921 [Collariella sp. IMI 366227]|nr:hypothetical protein N0V88_001921 [Collariella sp. IMI 366227]